MTWILDPADPAIAAWRRGEPPPQPTKPKPTKTVRYCGPLVSPERVREWRRKDSARRKAERHARAIAEGREPGKPGRPRKAGAA